RCRLPRHAGKQSCSQCRAGAGRSGNESQGLGCANRHTFSPANVSKLFSARSSRFRYCQDQREYYKASGNYPERASLAIDEIFEEQSTQSERNRSEAENPGESRMLTIEWSTASKPLE